MLGILIQLEEHLLSNGWLYYSTITQLVDEILCKEMYKFIYIYIVCIRIYSSFMIYCKPVVLLVWYSLSFLSVSVVQIPITWLKINDQSLLLDWLKEYVSLTDRWATCYFLEGLCDIM